MVLLSMASLSIALPMACMGSTIDSTLGSELDEEVEACGSSSLIFLVSCYFLFLLDADKFTSTSVASSIMSSRVHIFFLLAIR